MTDNPNEQDSNFPNKMGTSTPNTGGDGNKICGVGLDVIKYFDSLRWNSIDDKQFKDCLNSFLPPEVQSPPKLHSLKLIDSHLVPYPETEYNIVPMSDVEANKYFCYIPGVDGKCNILTPTLSCLINHQQHRLYNFLCRKKFNRPLSESERVEYQELIQKARQEHPLFQDFAQTQWIKYHCTRTMDILPEISSYLDKLWQAKKEQCLALYPETYKSGDMIPLALNDPNNDFTILEYKEHLFAKGAPPRISCPRLNKPHELICDFETLCRIKPVSQDTSNKSKPLVYPLCPVSVDMYMDRFLQQEDVDVVITPSGIKTIVDQYRSHKEWVLPVTIKTILKLDGETNKKVVIIDKAFPSTSMSVHDKNIWHAKLASKWALILNEKRHLLANEEREPHKFGFRVNEEHDNILTDTVRTLEINGESENKNKITTSSKEAEKPEQTVNGSSTSAKPTVVFFKPGPVCVRVAKRSVTEYDDCNTEVVEEFGVDPGPKPSVKIQPKQPKVHLESNNQTKSEDPATAGGSFSTSNDEKTTDSELLSPRPRCTYKRKMSFDHAAESTENDSEMPLPIRPLRGNLMPTRRKGMVNPALVYSLWNLHKSQTFHMSKYEQRSLNILVRRRGDGTLLRYIDNAREFKEVCVSSKLEFQPEYGVSKMSASELIREYVDMHLRQSCNLTRVHTVGHTKEVMLTVVKSASEVKETLQAEKVKIHKIFDPLYAVLTKLIDLKEGKYLLHHTPKMGVFAQLLRDSSESCDFNVSDHLYELRLVDNNVPAVPIDPFTLTTLHHRDKLPPALFRFRYSPSPSKFLKKPAIIKRKKGRKKKKKLKKNAATESGIDSSKINEEELKEFEFIY